MEIQWEEPPESARIVGTGQHRGRYIDFARALQQRRDTWAKLPNLEGRRTAKGAAATAQNIRRGHVKGFKKGEYETAVDGTEVWVRWTGPANLPEQASSNSEERGIRSPERRLAPVDVEPVDDETTEARLAPQIRRWAQEQGMPISTRGNIPQNIKDQYYEEHPFYKPALRVGE